MRLTSASEVTTLRRYANLFIIIIIIIINPYQPAIATVRHSDSREVNLS